MTRPMARISNAASAACVAFTVTLPMQHVRAAPIAVVVGLGGVGSWTAEALARSGVAALTLIDLDHVVRVQRKSAGTGP